MSPRVFWSLKPNYKLLYHGPTCYKEKQKKNIWDFGSHSCRIIQDHVVSNNSKPFQVQYRHVQTLWEQEAQEDVSACEPLYQYPLWCWDFINALNCYEICNEIIQSLDCAFFPIVNRVNLQRCSRCWLNKNRLNENSMQRKDNRVA